MVHDSGRPNFGVNPPLGGREPSFPNPSANLVGRGITKLYTIECAGIFFFGIYIRKSYKTWEIQRYFDVIDQHDGVFLHL